jgi:hypothetical protein
MQVTASALGGNLTESKRQKGPEAHSQDERLGSALAWPVKNELGSLRLSFFSMWLG